MSRYIQVNILIEDRVTTQIQEAIRRIDAIPRYFIGQSVIVEDADVGASYGVVVGYTNDQWLRYQIKFDNGYTGAFAEEMIKGHRQAG